MESQKDYHSINDRENKAIIQQLIEESDDDEVAKVISSYNIGATSKDIRQKLDKFNKPSLEKAANHLQITTKDKKKTQILDDIIRGIECLLKEFCPVCEEYFNIELGDQPLFKCIKCNQGSHNPCYQEMHTLMSSIHEDIVNSFHYMCCSCSEFNKVPNMVEAKKHPLNPITPLSQPNEASQIEEEIPSGQPHQNQDPQSQITQLPPSQPDDLRPNEASQDPNPANSQTRKATKKKPNTNPEVPVCSVYKWGRCPQYETCKFCHPPRCWNWLSSGKCRFNKECKYHHPPLCKSSVKEKKCLNESCIYFHLSKTLRRNAEEETLRTSLHQKTYNAQQKKPQSENHPTVNPDSQANEPSSQPESVKEVKNPQLPSTSAAENQALHVNNVPFLVTTIRDLLREDLQKELAQLKAQLTQQISKPTAHQINPWVNLSNIENQTASQVSPLQLPSMQQLTQFQQKPKLLFTHPQTVQSQQC